MSNSNRNVRFLPVGAGLIYGALAVVWLVFLVPWFLSRREVDPIEDGDIGERFTRAVRIIQLAHTDEVAEVSTPLTRRAARYEIHQTARLAARRRRRVLIGLVTTSLLSALAAPFTSVTWWQALVPFVLLGAFVYVAHVSVTSMNARLDARLAAIGEADDDEATVVLRPMEADAEDSHELSIEISAPIEVTGSLWDPIPVVAPTYLDKPLVPRTVRTIDLSAPEPTVSVPRMPVVAEPLEAPVADERRDRAVGE